MSAQGVPPLLLPYMSGDQDFRECLIACDKLLSKKGHDYTQGAVDRSTMRGPEQRAAELSNFYKSAKRFGVTPQISLGHLLFKHIDAIETYIKQGQVESEPIETRIFDCINFLLLLYKMHKLEGEADQAAVEPIR